MNELGNLSVALSRLDKRIAGFRDTAAVLDHRIETLQKEKAEYLNGLDSLMRERAKIASAVKSLEQLLPTVQKSAKATGDRNWRKREALSLLRSGHTYAVDTLMGSLKCTKKGIETLMSKCRKELAPEETIVCTEFGYRLVVQSKPKRAKMSEDIVDSDPIEISESEGELEPEIPVDDESEDESDLEFELEEDDLELEPEPEPESKPERRPAQKLKRNFVPVQVPPPMPKPRAPSILDRIPEGGGAPKQVQMKEKPKQVNVAHGQLLPWDLLVEKGYRPKGWSAYKNSKKLGAATRQLVSRGSCSVRETMGYLAVVSRVGLDKILPTLQYKLYLLGYEIGESNEIFWTKKRV